LLSGLVTTATPSSPPVAATTHGPPSTASVASTTAVPEVSSQNPTAVPTPSPTAPAVPSTGPTTPTPAPTAARQRSGHSGGRAPGQRTPTASTTVAPVPPGGDDPHRIDAKWTSYLPAPETGLKIFAGGLLALAVAIAGLATLAIRRRGY